MTYLKKKKTIDWSKQKRENFKYKKPSLITDMGYIIIDWIKNMIGLT